MTSDSLQNVFARAVDLHRRGDFASAEDLYRAILAAVPHHAESWHLLGVIAHQTGQHATADELISKAIGLKNTDSLYFSNRGEARRALGRLDDAVADYESALALSPGKATVLSNLGLALRGLGKLNEAEHQLRRALKLNPAFAEAFNNLGLVLMDLGRADEAIDAYLSAISQRNNYAEAHANLGTVYQAREDWTKAEASYRAAIASNPGLAGAHFNLGIVLAEQSRNREASAAFRQAIKVNPRYAEAYSNLSVMCERLGDDAGYVENARRAVELDPNYSDGHRNLGVAYLHVGNYAQGWDEWDWRFGRPYVSPPALSAWPRWQGQPTDSVLVWYEQGLGDEIISASMLADMQKDVRQIYCQIDRRLNPIFARSFPGVLFLERGVPLPSDLAVSAHMPSGSLGMFYRNALEKFPTAASYLRADENLAQQFRARIAPNDAKVVVGISWMSKAVLAGADKTTRLVDWTGILDIPGIQFVDLQYGDTEAERRELQTATGIDLLHLPDLNLRDDLDGLAALISACDLVISISNTTTHIAGALGVPTWVMVPTGSGRLWYWGGQKSTTPWYPSVRILRQSQIGVWADVLSTVASDLKRFVAEAQNRL